LRTAEHIRAAVDLLATHDVDSVVSVSTVPTHMNPLRMLRVDAAGRAVLFVTGEPVRHRVNRRQDMPDAWVMNGAVYAFRTRVLFDPVPSLYGDSTLAMPMPEPTGISIDTPEDWVEAEKAIGYHHGS
jgi:N-acylneuraminate cytidylyltransferase